MTGLVMAVFSNGQNCIPHAKCPAVTVLYLGRDAVFSWFTGWGAVMGTLGGGGVKGAQMEGRGWSPVEVWGCLARKWKMAENASFSTCPTHGL